MKTAQKIIVELSGKMLELGVDEMITPQTTAANSAVYDEAFAALQMLGFQKAASEKVLKTIFKDNPAIAVEEAIRTALKHL